MSKRAPRMPRLTTTKKHGRPQRDLRPAILAHSPDNLAWALDELRRWFAREVAFERARRNLADAGVRAPVVDDASVADDNPRRSGVFDAEIRKAALGKRHRSVDDLWLIEAGRYLSDEQIARILYPVEPGEDVSKKDIANASKARRRAAKWWNSRTR